MNSDRITIAILFIGFLIMFGAFIWAFEKIPEEIIEPTYSIYEYDYNTTIVYRYKEHKVIYEYSYAGLHLVQIIEHRDQVTILEFPDQNTAKEFANSFLSDIRRDEKL